MTFLALMSLSRVFSQVIPHVLHGVATEAANVAGERLDFQVKLHFLNL